MAGHAGIVRRIGWMTDEETGASVFRAWVDYPDGPPGDLPFGVVWESRPVKIIVQDDAPQPTSAVSTPQGSGK